MEYTQSLPTQVEKDPEILKPSAQFKKQVINVINALLLFITVYIVLFIVGMAVAVIMVAIGCMLLAEVHMFAGLILGIGLVLSGVMLAFFLIKSIFIKTPERTNNYEITDYDQPELFDFIRQLTDESGAPFPKHIYISPEVNASVFFDSSFWSMFFPVRKNLVIGMALVNCVNQSELRAVLAHEFGHFSQRSMRFGSYVYNFNQVIYNTLYENQGYDKMMRAWARWHYLLRLTATINIKIIKLLQSALKKMYTRINKAHLGLSREMEFHADAMAAYYGGTKNAVMALRRLEIGDDCYNTVLGMLTQKMNEGYRSANIYPPQLVVLERFAQEQQMQVDKNGIPVITKDIAALGNTRVIVQNQWASHPTMSEREGRLNKANIIVDTINEPATALFRDIEVLQQQITAQLYSRVNIEYEKLQLLDTDTFQKTYNEQFEANTFSNIYRGFYNNRHVNQFDVDEAVAAAQSLPHETTELLFSDENCNLPQFVAGMQKDVNALHSVGNPDNTDLISFDFEGVRYEKAYASSIRETIEKQITETEQKIAELDRRIFISFYQLARQKATEQSFTDEYKLLFLYQSQASTDYDKYNTIMADMRPVYSKMKPDAINATLSRVYDRELTIKPRLREVLNDTGLMPYITDDQQKDMEKYLSKNWIYYESAYDNFALEIFNKGLNAYVDIIAKRNFQFKKSLLQQQASLLS